MNTKKIIKYILIAIPLLFVAMCSFKSIDFVPDINPHPTQKVRIHGEFPFDKNMTLSFYAFYKTDNSLNPLCTKEYILAGTSKFDRKYKIDIPVTRNKNEYEAYFYLDYILPGLCNWTFFRFGDSVQYHDKQREYITMNSSYPGDDYDYTMPKNEYMFSNILMYDCHIAKATYKDLSSSKYLSCDSKKSDSGKTFFPYKNARDITQNYINTKEKTEWTK